MKILLLTAGSFPDLQQQLQGHTVMFTDDYSAALQLFRAGDISVVVLDGRLPRSFLLLQHMRESAATKIIYLCENDTLHSIYQVMQWGADDFMVHPVSENQLIARIYMTQWKNGSIFTTGDIVIDTTKAMVTKAGRNIYLSQVEYRILLILVRNQGRVVPRAEIFEQIWDESDYYINENTVAVYIRRIRAKLGDSREKNRIIKTMRGVGYYV